MKKIFLILLICASFIQANAQDPNYTGIAKNQVAYFWENAKTAAEDNSLLQTSINNMKYALNKTKEKDPSYITISMEAELKKWVDKSNAIKLEAASNTVYDKRLTSSVSSVSNTPKSLLDWLFVSTNISIGSSYELPKAQSKIDLYKERTQNLLSLDYTPAKINDIRILKGNIAGMLTNTNREIGKIDDQLNGIFTYESLSYIYYSFQYYLAYWDAAQKIFSEDASYSDMYKNTLAASEKIGSLEKLKTIADNNLTNKIKNNKMVPAVMHDATTEKMMIDAFNKRYQQEIHGTAIKTNILQADWHTIRNEITGIITGRERLFALVYKGADGKCYLVYNVYLYQEYNGSTYTNTRAINAMSGSEMLCENAN